jgi:hypothetical protein
MSSPRASALPPVISRAGRPAPSRCSESLDSPSSRDDQPRKESPHIRTVARDPLEGRPFARATFPTLAHTFKLSQEVGCRGDGPSRVVLPLAARGTSAAESRVWPTRWPRLPQPCRSVAPDSLGGHSRTLAQPEVRTPDRARLADTGDLCEPQEWPRGASTDGQRRHRGGIA